MLTADQSRTNHGFDSVGGHVRDMNLFKDDDGTAYVMYSSEGNEVMYIAKLNEEYTGLAKDAEEMKLEKISASAVQIPEKVLQCLSIRVNII